MDQQTAAHNDYIDDIKTVNGMMDFFYFQVSLFQVDSKLACPSSINPDPVNLVFCQHALPLCLCSWPG